MEKLYIAATQYTPEISMDPVGVISLKGKSYPENTFEFYTPVMQWLETYFDGNSAPQTTVNMEIIYFNSSSSKLFFDFFDVLDENKGNSKIKIAWFFDRENESAEEAGEDFRDDFESLDFQLIAKENKRP